MGPEPERRPSLIDGSVRYVALGDSYTIGTGVGRGDGWPDQLVRRLGDQAVTLELVANLGVNGHTSADLIRTELPALTRVQVDLLTLLIGVNDVVQGVAVDRYAANLDEILAALLGRVPRSRIVTVSTPDYTVTPAGAAYGEPDVRAAEIRRFNAILAAASRDRGIAHVNVHDLSLRAATDRGLVAGDGLHPSGAQYGLWVDRIAPVVAALLTAPLPEPRSSGT